MRGFRILLGLLAVGTAGVAQAATLPFGSLYVFGDSLVDSGNVLAATGGTRGSTAEGYKDGRFSNGYNFADYLSLDIAGTPANAFLSTGGNNYAFGGAQAAPSRNTTTPQPLNLTQQIATFASRNAPIASDALVLVTIGGNDVREFVTNQANAPTSVQTFTALGTGLQSLIGLGARNIVVTGLPDIGTIPATAAALTGAGLQGNALTAAIMQISGISSAYNDQFRVIAGTADASPLAQVSFFDFAAFQRSLIANPAAFGFANGLNTTLPCIVVPNGSVDTSCLDGQGRQQVFYDAIHPTTEIHAAIARGITGTVLAAVPEPASWAMMIAGFGLVGGALRRREREMVGA